MLVGFLEVHLVLGLSFTPSFPLLLLLWTLAPWLMRHLWPPNFVEDAGHLAGVWFYHFTALLIFIWG